MSCFPLPPPHQPNRESLEPLTPDSLSPTWCRTRTVDCINKYRNMSVANWHRQCRSFVCVKGSSATWGHPFYQICKSRVKLGKGHSGDRIFANRSGEKKLWSALLDLGKDWQLWWMFIVAGGCRRKFTLLLFPCAGEQTLRQNCPSCSSDVYQIRFLSRQLGELSPEKRPLFPRNNFYDFYITVDIYENDDLDLSRLKKGKKP